MLETLAVLGEKVVLLEFILATALMFVVVRKLPATNVRSVVSYLLLGTTILTTVSLFLIMGPDGHGLVVDSFDVWWHILFYAAFAFYYLGVKLLVGLGKEGGAGASVQKVGAKDWTIATVIVLFVFFVATAFEGVMPSYTDSSLNTVFGLHHFVSFVLAGLVASYLFTMKSRLGMLGQAIATPFIVAVAALSLQHLWELVTESWGLIDITSETIESVELIFMFVAGTGIIWSAIKLKKFANSMM